MKRQLDQQGFTVVEAILLFVILAIVGATGCYVYYSVRKSQNTINTANLTLQANSAHKKVVVAKHHATGQVLVIKEWGVQLKLPSTIVDANYEMVTSHIYKQGAAFLSTDSLDRTAACKQYSLELNRPTYQLIDRFSLNDEVTIDTLGHSLSAESATQQYPQNYIKLGNFVYHYDRDNGIPCETQAQLDAFNSAFQTLAPVN